MSALASAGSSGARDRCARTSLRTETPTAAYQDTAKGAGLYQMGARYYQPASGRFTQLDPHPGRLLTVDRYAYTSCNPVNYTGPTGLESVDPALAQALACAWGAASFAVAGEVTPGGD